MRNLRLLVSRFSFPLKCESLNSPQGLETPSMSDYNKVLQESSNIYIKLVGSLIISFFAVVIYHRKNNLGKDITV